MERNENDVACKTCNDNGLIGGPSFYEPGEGGVPCPDCMAPNTALWSVKAVQDLSRVKQWLNDVPEPGTRSVITMMRLVAGVIELIESNAAAPNCEPKTDSLDDLIADLCKDPLFAAAYQAERDRIKAKIASGELRLVVEPLFTHPPHALAASQAEVKRLREALRIAMKYAQPMIDREKESPSNARWMVEATMQEETFVRAALSTPADTAEYDRLVADAGRAKWRRVEDEMPAPKTDVLVRCLRGNGETFDVAGLFHGEWMSCATERYTKGTVTHWMPLPDAPDAALAAKGE